MSSLILLAPHAFIHAHQANIKILVFSIVCLVMQIASLVTDIPQIVQLARFRLLVANSNSLMVNAS